MEYKTQAKLDHLAETKALIRAAIEGKGQTVEDSDTFRSYAEKIAAISSTSADTRYVIFKSEDGAAELYSREVLSGNDCGDVIALGLLEEQAKEPTNTEIFTRSGYALTAGGEADPSALKNVTEDRTVYVAFEASTRYYTVRFFDGEELVHTVYAQYGTDVAHTLEKDGYIFAGWNPAPTNITADLDCYAVWAEKITFANATWAQIAEISEAGEAENYFAIGDTRSFVFNDTENIVVEIVGFNHDPLADGTGTAGISVICKTLPSVTYTSLGATNYDTSLSAKLLAKFPDDLAGIIKPIKKVCNTSASNGKSNVTGDKTVSVWIPSVTELNVKPSTSITESDLPKYMSTLGSVYEKYASAGCPSSKYGSSVQWNTRTYWRVGSGYNLVYCTGSKFYIGNGNQNTRAFPFGFCI